MVNTRKAPRRELRFETLSDLQVELNQLQSALDRGTLTHTGNWTPGQNFEHVGKFFKCSMDGFEASAPWIMRFAATLLFKKRALGGEPMPAGLPLPKQASSLLPSPSVSDHDGLAFLQQQIDRLRAGERMTHPSPIFGPLTHDEWMTIQLKHAAMHLGFLKDAQTA
ncbi:MAG: DUF1569 domain-containing protein [Phycisphaeraceae bacterium]|nr:DUF1569 domain-containing protein [Phycisphaeraceae bacterium]MCW5762257.1 DUF1569 domain-containing protein [Phycisphaeraceae bacterium]